jgi:hypothetical protein
MSVPNEIRDVQGASELHDWLGYWPDFHDSEIISLYLNREGISSLRVHAWHTTKEVDENSHYVMAKHIVVEFILENISDLSMDGFSQQNVVSGIDIEKIGSGFRVTLGECYGLAGRIEAERISLRITPGNPS